MCHLRQDLEPYIKNSLQTSVIAALSDKFSQRLTFNKPIVIGYLPNLSCDVVLYDKSPHPSFLVTRCFFLSSIDRLSEGMLLQILIFPDRRVEILATTDRVVTSRKECDDPKYQDRPIHPYWRGIWDGREPGQHIVSKPIRLGAFM